MRIKTPREKRLLYFKTTLRWVLYYAVIFICFLIMVSGTWLKPILLVPAAIAVAVNNNMYASAVTGAICGFLIDISCDKLFGYNAVLLAFFCILTTLLFELYLRPRFANFMLITAVASYIQCRLDYKFYYQIWNYANVERIFVKYTLRVWVYTVAASLLVYLAVWLINKLLMPKEHLTIEEAIKIIEK